MFRFSKKLADLIRKISDNNPDYKGTIIGCDDLFFYDNDSDKLKLYTQKIVSELEEMASKK